MRLIPPTLAGALLAGVVSPDLTTEPAWAAGRVLVPTAAMVSTDTVLIRLTADAATVTQRIPAFEGRVEAHAIRLEGQELHVIDAMSRGARLSDPGLEHLTGAYHLRVGNGVPVELRYRVTGRLDRVPLFVSSPEAQLASAPVTLLVELTGESSRALDLGTSLPRFRRTSEHILTTTLSSTPTFVRLDAAGDLSFARAADLAVVVLILLAAVWAWRTARRSDVLASGAARASPGGDVE